MDKFRTVLNITKKQASLHLALVALLTAGGEQIFSSVVFKCPCNQLNFIYGLVFLLVPALALTTLGLIMSKTTWKLVTGLCKRTDKVCGSCSRVKSLANVLFQISTFAFLAPSTWIAVALLNGVFIECAMTGTKVTLFNNHLCEGRKEEVKCLQELHSFPCGKGDVPQDVRDEVLLTLRAESQVVGWLLIATIFLSYLAVTCLAQCSSPVGYLQLKFWRRYTQEESAALDSHMTEHARKLADRNVKSFFTSTKTESVHTPSNKEWQKVSSLYMYRSKTGGQHYSPLHGFVESQTETQDDSRRSRSTDSVHITPAAVAFVEDGQASL
ncbi:calcium homeostasis modulator protein 6 [Eucyclogobius newberryi]|uniref:calcium homeostasis modulator protein 6 n=1 Tax=Eucyclogobius newberryi TaxID=166745 RepID=UPI003B5B59E5